MANDFEELSQSTKWRLLVEAAKQGAKAQGYSLSKMPGRGLSNIWTISKGGKSQIASIRTTRDRWFAFPPLEGGKKWRTLDEVEVVIVAATDSKEDPKKVEVYIFPADEVRERFNAAYKARANDGQANQDGFGMWVALDTDTRGIAASVGSGINKKHKPVAVYSMADVISEHAPETELEVEDMTDFAHEAVDASPSTIGEVMAWARKWVAEIAGVAIEAVKLDLKVEY